MYAERLEHGLGHHSAQKKKLTGCYSPNSPGIQLLLLLPLPSLFTLSACVYWSVGTMILAFLQNIFLSYRSENQNRAHLLVIPNFLPAHILPHNQSLSLISYDFRYVS